MARDKKRDDDRFNCSEKHEFDYVCSLYDCEYKITIETFLEESCKDNSIKNSTHIDIYKLIEHKLGLPIPN